MEVASYSLDAWHVAYISVEAVIALASVLGNVLVVWAVKLNHALRDTTFSLIVSLAVADIAVAALAIPAAVLVSLEIQTRFYSCLFGCCVLCILTQNSILSLLAIAIDRYLRVKMPVRYRSVIDHRCTCLAVTVCWVVPAILGLLPMMGWHNKAILDEWAKGNDSTGPYINCSFPLVMSMDYIIYFNFFGLILGPLVIMTGLYFLVFATIRRQLSYTQVACKVSRKYYRKEMKLASSLALVLFLFAVCWIPLPIMNTVSFFCSTCSIPRPVLYFGILLSHANSAVNPIVYAFKIQKFRITFKKIWHYYFVGMNSKDTSMPQSSTQSVGGEKSDSV
ncbi:AA1R protein, partial [Atractosteus spatula]|nr:AA1R protein [Atractosteus spatula]